MQYAKYLFSIACFSLGVAMAPGCESEPAKGGGGEGGEGEWTGSGGAGVGSTSSGSMAGSTSGSMAGSTSGSMAGSTSGSMAGSTSGGMGGNGEPAAMNGMTAAHNAVRANVNPAPATPMPPLTWSSEVAAVAQSHADKCVFQHSQNSYGENIYATSGSAAPQDVLGSWASEVSDYNYGSNSCSGVCGHYTQVVWADSLLLGCGVTQCTQNSPFGGGPWEFWVCNYDPPGNYNGQKPY